MNTTKDALPQKTSARDNLLYLLLLVPTITELLETGHFPATARGILTDIVMTLAILAFILVSRRQVRKIEVLEEKIQHHKRFDTLTGLPLREQFDKDLESAIESTRQHGADLSLVCIDIDHFKDINENYGSATGDDVLKNFVSQIKSITPENRAQLYRLGSDTFGLLFSENATKNTEQIISELVTLKAGGDKLMSSYKAAVDVGTARLRETDKPHGFWSRAVQDMIAKRRSAKRDPV